MAAAGVREHAAGQRDAGRGKTADHPAERIVGTVSRTRSAAATTSPGCRTGVPGRKRSTRSRDARDTPEAAAIR